MKNEKIVLLISSLLFGSLLYAQDTSGLKKFNVQELIKQCAITRSGKLEFLNEENISAGIYILKTSKQKEQLIHEYDLIYYVMSGEGDFIAKDTSVTCGPGKIIFVTGNTDHYFLNIKRNLELLVLSPGMIGDSTKPGAEIYNLEDLKKAEKPNENTWNQFLNKPTMHFGLYQLPKSLGGDSTLVHKMDEINFVTKGTSKFSVTGKELAIKYGDIVYVRKGLGHYFHNLTSDVDVLILFERRSLRANKNK